MQASPARAFPGALQKLHDDFGVAPSDVHFVYDWSTPADLASLATFITALEHPYAQASGYDENSIPISRVVVEDLTRLLTTTTDEAALATIAFLRFYATLSWLGLLTIQRRFSEAWHAIAALLSLGYDGSPRAAIDTADVLRMLDRIKRHLPGGDVENLCLEWFGHFFYYVNNVGDLRDVAHAVFPFCSSQCQKEPMDDGKILLACHLIKFAQLWIPSEVDGLTLFLHAKFEAKLLSPESYKRVGMLLNSELSTITGKSREHYAHAVLAACGSDLGMHEPLQIFANLASQSLADARRNHSNILAAIHELNQSLGRLEASHVPYSKSHLFVLLWNLLNLLLDEKQASAVTDILIAWLGENPFQRVSNNLLVLPNGPRGPVYAQGDFAAPFASACSYAELTQSLSRFLDLNIVSRDNPDFQPNDPRRPGVPNDAAAPAFERNLVEFYQFRRAFEALAGQGLEPTTLSIFPWQNHPLQALILRETGRLLPFSKSFAAPSPFRPRSALLIDAGSFGSAIETDLVETLFRDAGIAVTRFGSTEAPALLAELRSGNHDLIWYAGHGQFDHGTVHTSHLVLGENSVLDLVELRKIQSARKALFVLNVCDGAAAQISNGPYEFGIGAMIANQNRAVISHLWPVNGTVALVFGAVLATNLTVSADYIEAFRETQLALLSGAPALEKILERHPEATAPARRALINGTSLDWSRFTHWASPFLCI